MVTVRYTGVLSANSLTSEVILSGRPRTDPWGNPHESESE